MRIYRFKSVAISANCARAEWSRGDASEIDCKTRAAKASEREASESRLSEFRYDPIFFIQFWGLKAKAYEVTRVSKRCLTCFQTLLLY